MAPSSTENIISPIVETLTPSKGDHSQRHEPLKLSGALDGVDHFEVTPKIGREYRNVDLAEWLKAPNSDELLRDLAITISQRGVVFFRKQDGLTDERQKELMQRLGQLSGKPSTSGLHVHPIYPVSAEARAYKGDDDEISVISSKFKEKSGKVYGETKQSAAGGDKRANKVYADKDASKAAFSQKKQSMKTEWHSDIAFENVPSDYTMLRLTEVPTAGGGKDTPFAFPFRLAGGQFRANDLTRPDTLWASGYELYDLLSPPYQKFLETLTATYHYAGLEVFSAVAERHGFKIHEGPRGSPDNVGIEFEAVHPVVRTNPVTGWRSLYAIGHHLKHINGVTRDEGKNLEDWFIKLLVENHDLQVRHRWESVNDIAIWDNRSTYHAATPDHGGFGHRSGHRAVSVGERPYLDPESRSRKETLGLV